MESPEGKGIARRAWDAYANKARKVNVPGVDRLAERLAAPVAVDLMGFWMMWHLYGGFDGLRGIGMSRASIYRRIKLFRSSYGMHPDEFELPGVALDVKVFQTSAFPQPAPQSQD
jgi:hypothetical protein